MPRVLAVTLVLLALATQPAPARAATPLTLAATGGPALAGAGARVTYYLTIGGLPAVYPGMPGTTIAELDPSPALVWDDATLIDGGDPIVVRLAGHVPDTLQTHVQAAPCWRVTLPNGQSAEGCAPPITAGGTAPRFWLPAIMR